MRRQTGRGLAWALGLILTAGVGLAAEGGGRLFELEAGALPEFRGAEAAWRVKVDTQMLDRATASLHFDTPDGLEFEARRLGFERRGPGSLTWRGRLTDSRESRAILSMEEGVLSGWIHTPFGQYEIRPLADGGSAVLRLSNEPLGGCAADTVARLTDREQAGTPVAAAPVQPPVAGDTASSIDVLALFTVEARDAAGGPAQIKSRIRLMIDLANENFGNSRMDARLKLAHVAMSPFRETGDMGDNLDGVRAHPAVQTLRETHSADLVALIQSSDPDFCGIAYLMHEVSDAFAPYAYSVTSYSCLTTLAHEVGHNLGMEHDPANGSPVAEALFPWAFGHFVRNDWRTVMSYPDPCGACTRIPYFSNPDVSYEGQPTGLPDERDNARVGDRTAGTVANFRLSGVVLADDFESGSLSAWQLNRGGMQLLQPGLEGDYLLEIPMTGLSSRRFIKHSIAGPGKGVDVEFLFNANSVELDAAEVDILALFGKGKPHTKLVLKQVGGTRRLSLVTKGTTGDYVEVGSTPVRANTSELIRVEWRAATDPEIADGFVRLTKNGGNRGALRNFANDRWVVRDVRLGIPYGSVGAPTPGRVYVDNYAASVPIEAQ